MKTPFLRPSAVVLLLVTLASGPVALAAVDHQHHAEHSTAVHKLRWNAGQKWATDAVLRESMDGINQVVAKALPLIHKDRFSDSDYLTLATAINQQVGYAVEHCKLGAKADAMFHIVIGELIGGAEMMEGKTAAARHAGVVRVKQALVSYGKYFQHPNWRAARA